MKLISISKGINFVATAIKMKTPKSSLIRCGNVYYQTSKVGNTINLHVYNSAITKLAQYSPIPTLDTFRDTENKEMHNDLERILFRRAIKGFDRWEVIKKDFSYLINDHKLGPLSKISLIVSTGMVSRSVITFGENASFDFDPVTGLLIDTYQICSMTCKDKCKNTNGSRVLIRQPLNGEFIETLFSIPCDKYKMDAIRRTITRSDGVSHRFDVIGEASDSILF